MLLVFSGCIKDNTLHQIIEGQRGIYLSEEQLNLFQQTPPRPLENPGKLAYYRAYLFLVDNGIGIHIIDLTDTAVAERISFLEIPAVQDLVIKDNLLYCDNGPHLLVLDISRIHHVQLINRIMHIFENKNILPNSSKSPWFECYDAKKGWLVGWEEAQLENPKCRMQ